MPYRWVIFGPALPAGAAGWHETGEPFRVAGALAFLVLAVLVVPVLALAVITAPGALLHALVPKGCRRWWRRHDWRSWFTRPMRHPSPPGALLQKMVRAADRDRCVACGVTGAEVRAQAVLRAAAAGRTRLSQSTLQLDHFFPWVLGGLLTFWNFFLLCPACNQAKSCYWEYRSGSVVRGHGDPARARVIVARERAARWSLLRCWRAAWALG